MTDRELLELAAKAAGIALWHEDVFTNGCTRKVSDNGILRWNPLDDDGDALRLAVLLQKMPVIERWSNGHHWVFTHGHEADAEPLGTDPYAATRRAIVKAAAEIGREK